MRQRYLRAASIVLAASAGVLLAPLHEAGAQPAVTTRVSVRIGARACKLSRPRVPAGAIVFTLQNRTGVAHSFAVFGRRSSLVKPHRRRTFRIAIRRPGRYRYVCRPSRKSRGVRERRGMLVVVKASPGNPPPPPSPQPPPPPPPPPVPPPPPPVPPPPPPPPPPAPPPPPGPPPPPPPHRIGVRLAGGFGEFYDRQNGQSFIPRGSIFVRRRLNETPGSQFVFSSSTFAVGAYDSAAAESALQTMSTEGYDVVRVFLDVTCRSGCLSDPSALNGLSQSYLANVADFLFRAKAKGLYVLLAAEALPYGSSYETLAKTNCCTAFGPVNTQYLTANGAEGHLRFWQALIPALNSIGAPLDAIWAYEIVAEQSFNESSPPLNLGSGLVTTGNGNTYDMAAPGQKQLMMDENLVWWTDQVRAAILAVDPTALVAIGFLWPKGPNPARGGDPRVARAKAVLDSSTVDFVDLHLNPGVELTFPQYMENYELSSPAVKPVVLGEFGAYQYAYATAADADLALRGVEADSCPYGFDGWLYWSWNTTEFGTGENPFWSGTAAGGLIEQALGPRLRPDPCAAPPDTGNLALGRPVTASSSVGGSSPSNVVDGLMANVWNAGGYPPQWIEIDLGAPVSIALARLFVSQYPNGPTTHRIYGRATSGDPWQLLTEISGVTVDNQVLEYSPPSPWTNIRYVQVATTASPSWVSWKEVELIAP
jgi:plastocyanin